MISPEEAMRQHHSVYQYTDEPIGASYRRPDDARVIPTRTLGA